MCFVKSFDVIFVIVRVGLYINESVYKEMESKSVRVSLNEWRLLVRN